MGAAIAEFKRSGMAEADVSAIVAAAGVAHGTFFFHFPTKEHVLLELERREEERIAKQFAAIPEVRTPDLASTLLKEAVRLVVGLERRLGDSALQRLSGAAFFANASACRGWQGPPVDRRWWPRDRTGAERGRRDTDVNPMNSAVFFLLGLYALLITTPDWPTQSALVEDYVTRTLRSMDGRVRAETRSALNYLPSGSLN